VRTTLISAVLAAILAVPSCWPVTTTEQVVLSGTAMAGPTCPVEQDPPDPDCAERPVAGAEIVVLDASGSVVARVTTEEDGTFRVALEPGSYQLVPQPVDGLMGGAPAAVAVDLEADRVPAPVNLAYDTGIR
jgi:hypothetical protein